LSNRIGIDLDNTILKYDELFYSLAIERSWIDRGCLCDKDAVKEDLAKNMQGINQKESRWRQLQAWAYGNQIERALLFEGFDGFVQQVRQFNCELFIVSHKTEFSNFDPSVPLRSNAIDTLSKRGFFKPISEGGLGFGEKDVFFASSLDEKIYKIRELNLTHFIDDLPKVIFHPEFPNKTKRILFASGSNEDQKGVLTFRTWKDIKEYFCLSNWLEKTFHSSLSSITLLPSSGNNRIYKIQMDNGENYAVKQYLSLKEDSRPRLEAEFNHLKALKKLGFQNIPQPVLKDRSWAVYSFIQGTSINVIGAVEIDKILSFITRLSDLSSKLKDFAIFPGSDSRSCLGDYIDQIEKRSNRLIMGTKTFGLEKEINHFFKQKLLPHKEFICSKFYNSIECLGWDLQRPFKAEQKIFSPSDFGFHNILRGTDCQEELYFIDFEYSGWDDPAKLMADFFHHVGQDVSWEHKWYLLEKFAAHRKQDPDFLKRWETIIDLVGLEWVLIVLNILDSNEMERKQFANPKIDPANLVKSRLTKAEQMINEMSERMKKGEKLISIPQKKRAVKH